MISLKEIVKKLLTLILISTTTTSDLTSLIVRLQSNNPIIAQAAERPLPLEDAHTILQESLTAGEYMPPHQPSRNISYIIKDGSCHVWISANGDDWTYHYCDTAIQNNMVKDCTISMLSGYYYCFMAGKDGLSLEASHNGDEPLMLNPIASYSYKVPFHQIVAATQAAVLADARYIEVTFSHNIGA